MFPRRSLAALAATLVLAGSANAAPAIWKVSDGNSSIWLFGSIHMLPAETDWRTDIFDSLLDEAEKVYFETDLGLAAQADILALTLERGFARDGRLLNQRIDGKLMSKVRSAAELYNVPVPTLLAMQPWMAAATISTASVAELGYTAEDGVEAILMNEIPSERQGFLETAQQQIDAISGGTEDDHIAMLAATLAEIQWTAGKIEEMKTAWLNGTPETLADVFLAEVGAFGDEFFDRLIIQRNKNWVVQIRDMLDEDEAAFLVVGAGHLVGEYSVVTLLEAEGFTSERVQ